MNRNTLIVDMTFSKIAPHCTSKCSSDIIYAKDSRTYYNLWTMLLPSVTYPLIMRTLNPLCRRSCPEVTPFRESVPVSPLPRQHRPVPGTSARHVPAE